MDSASIIPSAAGLTPIFTISMIKIMLQAQLGYAG
jgi:hypothetical protein